MFLGSRNVSFPKHARLCRKLSTIPEFDARYRQLTISLDKLAPRINLPANAVKILHKPAEFYSTIKAKINTATRRIFLSTLYVGKTEHELVNTLRARLLVCPELKLSILTDALRGTRESPNATCASLLAPLIAEFGAERVEISMFHTPNLHGWKKSMIPRRFDEGWGLQHMKLYGFDDEIMLSGANLSNDYFTDRQDRYHLFSSPEVVKFYERLHDAVASVSYQIQPSETESGYSMSWCSPMCADPVKSPHAFRTYTTNLINALIAPRPLEHCEFTSEDPPLAILYPLAQLTPLLLETTSTEQPVINRILDMLGSSEHKDTQWHFTAGYFNVFADYRSRLLRALGTGTIITASPDANGFYKSSGPSGMLAAGYSLLSKRFLRDAARVGKSETIKIHEWKRGQYGETGRWTYHAKGLWIQPKSNQSAGPSLTFVGSSNFTPRSQNLDLEATAVLITADHNLQQDLARELENLLQHSRTISEEDLVRPGRAANLRTRVSLWLCQNML